MILGREKVDFLNLPTPIDYLKNISEDLGINLYLKRDDLTRLGTGGNKLRKLEYLLKDAQDNGATALITVGGAQTNHGRLTAAVAAKYGLKCAIVTADPYPGELSANLLLDGIMNCEVYMDTTGVTRDEAMEKVAAQWEAAGEKPYLIPVGGSNDIGMLGYYECAMEMADQFKEMKLEDPRVVVTVGSLGTYIGLAAGQLNENLPFRLTGVAIEPFDDATQEALDYYNSAKEFHGMTYDASKQDFEITCDYTRGAYNNPVKEVREAIYYMGSKEGIIVDPCYTGKTFAGILDMVKAGEIKQGENVVMIHTGGIPGIYTPHHRTEMEKELIHHIHEIK